MVYDLKLWQSDRAISLREVAETISSKEGSRLLNNNFRNNPHDFPHGFPRLSVSHRAKKIPYAAAQGMKLPKLSSALKFT